MNEVSRIGTIVVFHPYYNIGDEHNYTLNEIKDIALDTEEYVSLPLYLDETPRGVLLKTERIPDDAWDAGQAGLVFVSRRRAREMTGQSRLTHRREEELRETLKREVEIYNAYLTGRRDNGGEARHHGQGQHGATYRD
jgi:hypothetical protein